MTFARNFAILQREFLMPFTEFKPLEISFRTKTLRTVCEIRGKAEREYGKGPASALRRRLADIRAAETVNDLLVGQPRSSLGDGTGRMVVNLGNSHRLVFGPNHPGATGAGTVDLAWSKVRRVKVLNIEVDNG